MNAALVDTDVVSILYKRDSRAELYEHAGLLERPAGEARQDQRLLGPDVVQHAQDFDLKLVDTGTEKTVFPTPRIPGRTSLSGKTASSASRRGSATPARRQAPSSIGQCRIDTISF